MPFRLADTTVFGTGFAATSEHFRESSAPPIARFRSHAGSRLSPPRKRLEAETTTEHRSKVAVVEIGDAGAMRNGDGQTAGHEGICKSGKSVETLGEVMVEIERPLLEDAGAGTAEAGCDGAGRRNTEGVLRLPIPGEGDVGFTVVSVLHARPPDLHQLFRIKIVVFDAAHDVTALV